MKEKRDERLLLQSILKIREGKTRGGRELLKKRSKARRRTLWEGLQGEKMMNTLMFGHSNAIRANYIFTLFMLLPSQHMSKKWQKII